MTRVSNEQNQLKTAGDQLASQVQTFDSLMNELAALLSDGAANSNSVAPTVAQCALTQPAQPARPIPRNVQQFAHADKPPQMPRIEKAPVA